MNKNITYFTLAILAQCMLLAAVPAKQIYTRTTGKLITIKTAPYDPYDFLSGYHVRLNYDISQPPGFEQTEPRYTYRPKDTYVYVILKERQNGIFSAVSMHNAWPENIPQGAMVIKGKKTYNRVEYGIESYFIPEKNREQIEKDLRDNNRQAKAQIKVDKYGNANLIRILVEDRVYEY